MANRHRLERVQHLRRPRDEVFAFFSEAANLERLTPNFLNFHILTPSPIEMRPGALIEYRLRLGGVPMNWLTKITVWEPGDRFVDQQLKGPYRYWHHLHEFTDAGDGTLMRDVVDYELPFGVLGDVAHAVFVKRTLQRIFDYRREVVESVFGHETDPAREDEAAPNASLDVSR